MNTLSKENPLIQYLNEYVVYDIEIFRNGFTITFQDQHFNNTQFVLHKDRNEFKELVQFIISKSEVYWIGFNNYLFDFQFIEWILNNYQQVKSTYKTNIHQIIGSLFSLSNQIIESENVFVNYKNDYKHIDLYLIHHFNNKARRCSLKWLEFAMKKDNISNIPFDYHEELTLADIENYVLPYNLDDVDATHEFAIASLFEIKHRLIFGKKHGMYLLTKSHTSISKMIFTKKLTESMKISYKELKELKTVRNSIHLKDVIFDYISFDDFILQALLKKLNNKIINNTDQISETFKYGDLYIDVGSGGLHGFPKKQEYDRKGNPKAEPVTIPQKWISNDEYQLMLVDVSSFYPNLAIKNKLKPEHLGDTFIEIYSNMYDERLAFKRVYPPTEESISSDLGLKLALNSIYGLSNSEGSIFRDLKYLVSITVNGQLLLLKLFEMLHQHHIKVVQANTDGLYIWIKKDRIELVKEICRSWEELTQLKLDIELFDRLFQVNVNNYLAVKQNGSIKEKGITFITKPEWHKDHSALVIQKAIQQNLLYDKPVREFINQHTILDDFLLGLKLRRNDWVEERYIYDGKYVFDKYYGVVRYAITKGKKAKYLEKVFASGKSQAVEKGWKSTVCNNKSIVSLDDIDRTYYIIKAEEITNLFVQPPTLF